MGPHPPTLKATRASVGRLIWGYPAKPRQSIADVFAKQQAGLRPHINCNRTWRAPVQSHPANHEPSRSFLITDLVEKSADANGRPATPEGRWTLMEQGRHDRLRLMREARGDAQGPWNQRRFWQAHLGRWMDSSFAFQYRQAAVKLLDGLDDCLKGRRDLRRKLGTSLILCTARSARFNSSCCI
jgi:hypothetical protein